MDADGANPDSGVYKDFFVSKSPALTDMSDAELHPYSGLLRAMNPTLLIQ